MKADTQTDHQRDKQADSHTANTELYEREGKGAKKKSFKIGIHGNC